MHITKPRVAGDQPCPIALLTQPDSWGHGWDSHAVGGPCQVPWVCQMFEVASLWDQAFEFGDQMGHGKTVGTKGSRRFAPNFL